MPTATQKTVIWTILGLTAFLLVSKFIIPNGENGTRDDVLIMGTNIGYPPFVFTNDRGETVGLDVDIANRIADILGRRLEIKNMGFDALIISLKNRNVDFIMGGISITGKRRSVITMVPYHGDDKAEMALVFWETLPSGVANVDDLLKRDSGAVIATQMGSTMEEYLEKYRDRAEIKSFEDIQEIVLDLRYAKSTAAVLEYDAAEALAERLPALRVIGFEVKSDELLGYGIGVAPKNKDMAAAIQEAVVELREQGVLDALSEKWFSKKGK